MKKLYRSSVMTFLLFAVAVILLFSATVGGAQAALSARSNNYYSAIELKNIGLDLIKTGPGLEGESARIGRDYAFQISGKNTGEIPQYVRVVVYRYWKDENGKILDTNIDPGMIITKFENNTAGYNDTSWYLDEDSSTVERRIYYYRTVLPAGKEGITELLYDQVQIDPAVAKVVKIVNGSYVYAYSGLEAVVDVEIDAIQTHHAQDAMRSAWGVSDTVMTALGIPNV